MIFLLTEKENEDVPPGMDWASLSLSCVHIGSLTKGTEEPSSAKGLLDIATKLRSKVSEPEHGRTKRPSLQTVQVGQETEPGRICDSPLCIALLLLLELLWEPDLDLQSLKAGPRQVQMHKLLQLCLPWGEANHKRLASISTSPVAPAAATLVGRWALGPEELERWWEVRVHSQEAGVPGNPHLSSTSLSPHPFLSTPSLPLLLPSLDLLSVDPIPSSFPLSLCIYSRFSFLRLFSFCPPSTVLSSLPSLFLPSFLYPSFPPFLSISFSYSFFSFTFLNFSFPSLFFYFLASSFYSCAFPSSCFFSLFSYNKQILLLHSVFYKCSFISSLFPAPS